MVLLIDINTILDCLLRREPFYATAEKVMDLCAEDSIDGCIALHTVTTIWYLLRKNPVEQRRAALKSVCELLKVVGTSHEEVLKAIDDDNFKDFEDCVQSRCAKAANADYIVTRNVEDYKFSETPAVSPEDILKLCGA